MQSRSMCCSQKGQVTVELALVFVILLILMLGIAETARALLNVHQLTQAAREGARAASLTPAVDSPVAQDKIRNRIIKVLQIMGKDIQNVRINIEPVDREGDGYPDVVDVRLEEDFNQITPIFLIPGLRNLIIRSSISMPLFMSQERREP